MLSRNEIKRIQSLSKKKVVQDTHLFVAEGVRIAKEMLLTENSIEIRKIYALPHWESKLAGYKSSLTIVTEKELSQISGLSSPNEIMIVAVKPSPKPPGVLKKGWTLVLDGIQDPGNMGTLIRTAHWFGMTRIVASKDTVSLYNQKVIQSAMGSFLRIPVSYVNLAGWLQKQILPVFGAVLGGGDINGYNKPQDGLLIIGNEGKGIRPDVIPHITCSVSILGSGHVESLNAAVAGGILMHWCHNCFRN
jgi:TrmH family RNA methyltransferase